MSQTQSEVFERELKNSIRRFGIEGVTDSQFLQLVKHYEMLGKWNKRLNLTRITRPRDAATLNYAESLYGTKFIAQAKTMLDIGTGAGFPAIPIAVALPELAVSALEANQKKSLFLAEAKFELPLVNLKVITWRAENVDLSEYDLLTCRALDHAEEILPPILNRLTKDQRLMLYCVQAMVDKLVGQFSGSFKVETNTIPESESRIIAIFSRNSSSQSLTAV
jgi:16S rRNA (guanine527-N7)-methyltransferase